MSFNIIKSGYNIPELQGGIFLHSIAMNDIKNYDKFLYLTEVWKISDLIITLTNINNRCKKKKKRFFVCFQDMFGKKYTTA